MNKYIVLLLIVMAAGCSSSSTPSKTIPMKIGDEGIANSLRAKLDTEGIWYRDIDKTTIEIGYPPPSNIIEFVNKAGKAVLPEGHHSSFPKNMLLEIMKELNDKQIEYKIVEFDEAQWLVWEEKDAQSVNDIIDEVSKRLNIQEISESDFKYGLK